MYIYVVSKYELLEIYLYIDLFIIETYHYSTNLCQGIFSVELSPDKIFDKLF